MRSVKKLLFWSFIFIALDTKVWAEFIDSPLANKALQNGDKKVLAAVADAETAGKSAAGVGLAAEKVATKGLGFGADLGRNLRAAAIRTGTTGAICGGKVGRSLASQMAAAAIAAGAAQVANEVGAANASGRLGDVAHKVVHGATQALAVGLRGGNPLAGAVGAIVGETVGEIVMERRTRAALQETLEQAQILHDMGQTLSQEEFDGLFAERLHMHQCGLSPAEIGQLAASGTALVGHLDIADAHSAAQTVTENNLSVWGGVKVAGKIAGKVFNPYVNGALTLYDLSKLAYKYYQSRCTGDEVAQAEVVREAKTDAVVMTVLTAAPKAVEVGAKAVRKSGQAICCAFDDFVDFLMTETSVLRPAFAGEARVVSGELTTLAKEVQESSALFNRKLAEKASKEVAGEGITLTPYGGPGGGHHIHMKSAYKSEPKYNPNEALCLGKQEMDRLHIDHLKVSKEQRRLCEELQKAGKPMTREEQNRIAVQSLQAGGASEQMARDIVARSQWDLKNKGIRQPTDMPWSKKDGK